MTGQQINEAATKMGFTWGHLLQILVIMGGILVFFLATESRVTAVEVRQKEIIARYDRDISEIKGSLRVIEAYLLKEATLRGKDERK